MPDAILEPPPPTVPTVFTRALLDWLPWLEPLAVDAVVYLVIVPLVVPAPALEHPTKGVLRPAHVSAFDRLMLTLVAKSWPERLVADKEIDHVYPRGSLRG